MKNEFSSFSFSQMIYQQLLRAYPPRHRAAYGAAMAQLFRDQCRDAWRESRNWGLLKLWLRILPDLASTSILERLAALNERKTMNEKFTNLLQSQRLSPMTVFVLVFLAVFFASATITLFLPKTYASEAKIFLRNVTDIKPEMASADYMPDVKKELVTISSDVVLEPVAHNMNLSAEWGKKYFGGQHLQEAETLKLLRKRCVFNSEPQAPVIEIQVYSNDPTEVMPLAHAIVESYMDHHMKFDVPRSGSNNTLGVSVIQNASPPYLARHKSVNILIGAILGAGLGFAAAGLIKFARFIIRRFSQRTIHAQ